MGPSKLGHACFATLRRWIGLNLPCKKLIKYPMKSPFSRGRWWCLPWFMGRLVVGLSRQMCHHGFGANALLQGLQFVCIELHGSCIFKRFISLMSVVGIKILWENWNKKTAVFSFSSDAPVTTERSERLQELLRPTSRTLSIHWVIQELAVENGWTLTIGFNDLPWFTY